MGLPAVKMEWDGRLGHRQKQNLLCVLPGRERQSVVPSGAPGHTGLRAHGTRRESAFDGGRPVGSLPLTWPLFMTRWCPIRACGTGPEPNPKQARS
jgi:hypothetical protein